VKEKELRDHAVCSICGKKIGHANIPLFWTVEIKRYGIKLEAVNRQQGLTMMLGGSAQLAAVMGPNEEMAECIHKVTLTVCEKCAVEESLPVAALCEMGKEMA
jgi:hypothetical protein